MNAGIDESLGHSEKNMKKLFRVIYDAILVRLGLRVVRFQFLSSDGTRIELDGIRCCSCQNYFWVEHADIELPPFCCYCGTKFIRTDILPNYEFDKERDSSN